MGMFGNEFINLGVGPGNARDAATAPVRSRAIAEAIGTLSPNGGYLYFPPGMYILESGFKVPENVTMYLSPGAILVPGRNDASIAQHRAGLVSDTDIVVRGSIMAARHQLVMSPYWPTRRDHQDWIRLAAGLIPSSVLPNDELLGMGRLLILGNQVPEIFPEWFGAHTYANDTEGLETRYLAEVGGGGRPADGFLFDFVDSTAALQAALDCAHRNRSLTVARTPQSAAAVQSRAAIPVVLSGRYLISKALRIGLREGDDPESEFGRTLRKPFVLRGDSGPGGDDKPSLRPHLDYPRHGALSVRV